VISSTLDESADNGSIPIPISRILRFQGWVRLRADHRAVPI
jgi:hypothetical protein